MCDPPQEFNLIDRRELAPLQELIDKLANKDQRWKQPSSLRCHAHCISLYYEMKEKIWLFNLDGRILPFTSHVSLIVHRKFDIYLRKKEKNSRFSSPLMQCTAETVWNHVFNKRKKCPVSKSFTGQIFDTSVGLGIRSSFNCHLAIPAHFNGHWSDPMPSPLQVSVAIVRGIVVGPRPDPRSWSSFLEMVICCLCDVRWVAGSILWSLVWETCLLSWSL